MTKAELLSKLDEKALRNIVKNEELTVPKTYGKRALVKYLEGTLTLEQIRKYSMQVYERETKRTIIHETIKEKGIRIKARENSKIQFNKHQTVEEIVHSHEKIDLIVLEELARRLHEPRPSGKEYNLYSPMSDDMVKEIQSIFIKKESDGGGLFLEFRTANFMKQHVKGLKQVKIRSKFADMPQLDVIGFNSDNVPIAMAECKDTSVKTDYLANWLDKSRRLFKASQGKLKDSYFITTNKLSDECLKSIETNDSIDCERGLLKMGVLQRKVHLSVYEVRQKQYTKIFPKK